jgi:hypothetical protein
LARYSIKQGQSGRMTYWKLLTYRRLVRTLESNDRRRTSGDRRGASGGGLEVYSEQLKDFVSKQVYQKEGIYRY